MKIEIAASEAI